MLEFLKVIKQSIQITDGYIIIYNWEYKTELAKLNISILTFEVQF